jgi:hypothetical protein
VVTTEYEPTSVALISGMERLPAVAPVRAAVPWNHWYDSGRLPPATTLNLAVPPG